MTEDFALQQVLRNGRAVDCEKRFLRSLTVIVDRASDDLFAGTTFAEYQHGHMLRRHSTDRSVDFLHRRALPDQQLIAHTRILIGWQFRRSPHQSTGFSSGLHQRNQSFRAEGLQNVFERPGLHGLNRSSSGPLSSHENDWNPCVGLMELMKQVQPREIR